MRQAGEAWWRIRAMNQMGHQLEVGQPHQLHQLELSRNDVPMQLMRLSRISCIGTSAIFYTGRNSQRSIVLKIETRRSIGLKVETRRGR